LLLLLMLAALAGVWFTGLDGVGLLGPDEPRYAAIGREMALSGDWLTPRLWGSPWFEKPPLLYWMTAAAHLCGLGDDLAPRAPVALLSLAFLLLQFLILHRLEGERLAWLATLLLSTTAGWAAYSQIGVTDLPLAATFNAALLFGLLWFQHDSRRAALAAGACFGLAILAKGLVAGVLILPFLWFARRRWKQLLPAAGVALVVSVPWYAAMLALHGRAFFDEFFLRHHFSRFADNSLQHGQPFWYYLPVLLGGLFPWPVLLGLLRPACWRQDRHRIVALTFAAGLLFFSLSNNKLPGYLLPLIPPLCLLLALALDSAIPARRSLALSALLLGLCPVIATILPDSLLFGLRRATLGEVPWEFFAFVLPLAIGVWWLDRFDRRLLACAVVATGAAAGLLFVKVSAEPVLDQLVSARGLWRKLKPHAGQTCVESLHRNWRYGLNYYSRMPLPDCEDSSARIRVVQERRALPRIEMRPPPPDPPPSPTP
jgi:4-amino-4-deoxy-L-arabinose transferase-like glycosyltransferase